MAQRYLKVNEYLRENEFLRSANGLFFAIQQTDGNLVVYRGSGPDRNRGGLWGSNRAPGEGHYFAVMQADGNLSTYRGTSPADNQGWVWSACSTAQPDGPYFVVLNDDGTLCIHRGDSPAPNQPQIWCSGTSVRYVAIKAHNGKYIGPADDYEGTLRSAFPELTLRCVFELVSSADRNGVASMRPFGSDYFVDKYGERLTSIGWDGLDLQIRDQPDGSVAFALGARYMTADAEEYVVGDRTAIDAWERFHLVDCVAMVTSLLKQANCCGTEDSDPSHPRRPMWDDDTHKWLVNQAFDALSRVADLPNVDKLIALWKLQPFRDQVFKGLHDADYEAEYKGFVFSTHFYDPDKGRSWYEADGENALTECLRFAGEAFSLLHEAGWPATDSWPVTRAGYCLGLALHYLTDLTQPMHAANFANILPFAHPSDWRHEGYETRAELEHATFKIAPEDIPSSDIKSLMARDMKSVVIATARFSKGVFTTDVSPRADAKVHTKIGPDGGSTLVFDNSWSARETAAAFEKSFTYAQKAVPAFLATWAGLTGFYRPPRVIGSPRRAQRQPPTFINWHGTPWVLYAQENVNGAIALNSFDEGRDGWDQSGFGIGVGRMYDSHESPAGVVLGKHLYAAWHPPDSDDVYFCSHEGALESAEPAWSEPTGLLPGIQLKQGTAPILIEYAKRLVAVWVDRSGRLSGGSNEQGIHYATCHPVQRTLSTGWTSQIIGGLRAGGRYADTPKTPAAAVYDDKLWVAWRPHDNRQSVAISTFDHRSRGWTAPASLPSDVRTSETPALAVVANQLALFWRDDDDHKIRWIKSANGRDWDAGREVIDVSSDKGVAAAAVGGRLFVGYVERDLGKYVMQEVKAG
jgi:hypothetical protein